MTNNNQNWQERLKEKWLASSGITTIDFILQEIGQEKEASRREAIKECIGVLIEDLRLCSAHQHDLSKFQQLLNNNQSGSL